jgi:hypothetical protein
MIEGKEGHLADFAAQESYQWHLKALAEPSKNLEATPSDPAQRNGH